MWKDFFYFSKKEKQGVVVLVILLFLAVALNILVENYPVSPRQEEDAEALFREYEDFLSSLEENEPARNERPNRYPPKEEAAELFFFDPNTADSIALRRLGISKFAASNILNYRAKGGLFRHPGDLRKIYGLDEDRYASLLPYIRIKERPEAKTDIAETPASTLAPDTTRTRKYDKGTIIDLNTAGTDELTGIPGIGKSTANKIIAYRNRLGGFYETTQLAEIGLEAGTFAEWLTVTEGQTLRMNLNKASIERLRAHPYFNFYQAKAIVEYRKKKGEVRDLKQFSLYEEFSEEDFRRMGYYVEY